MNTQLVKAIWGEGINGIFAACMYAMMQGQTFMFFLFYLKRMVTIGFLIMIAPLITITYSIDKMGDGKAQALNAWLKELSYNILIQPFHCVIYLAFFGAISDMLTATTYGNISTYILAFVVLLFMKKAEELLRKIFHFEASSMPTISETGQNLMNATGKFTQLGMKAGTAFAGFKAAGGFKTLKQDAKQFRENRRVNKELKRSFEKDKQQGRLGANTKFEDYKNSEEGKQKAESIRKKFTAKGTNSKKMSAKAKERREKKDRKITNKAIESLRSEMSEEDFNAFSERLANGDENAQQVLNARKEKVKESKPKKAIKGIANVGGKISEGIQSFVESDTGKVLGAFVQDSTKLAAGIVTGSFMAGMTSQANDIFSGAQLGYGFAKGILENSHGTITESTTDLAEKYLTVTGANSKDLEKIFNSIKSNGDAGMYKTLDDTLKKFINEVTKLLGGDADRARELAYNIQIATMDSGKDLDLDNIMDQLKISGDERQSILDESSKFSKTYIESKVYSNIKLDESAGMDVDTLRENVEKKVIRHEKKIEKRQRTNINVQVSQNPDGTTSATATADSGNGQTSSGSTRTSNTQNNQQNHQQNNH